MTMIDNVGRYYQIGANKLGCDMYTLSVTIDQASGLLQVVTVAESDSLFPYLCCKAVIFSDVNCTLQS